MNVAIRKEFSRNRCLTRTNHEWRQKTDTNGCHAGYYCIYCLLEIDVLGKIVG